eukprot:CAMPEP_0184306228 /NCGR_PEP_ID=MMETSP1049-20130417/15281_1 /TAXON_ID=77928 /ORGANISM="Proteomonas sulcata, Strain CCMP704" /LENGTH=60 /DNA_ID=CAMNT_0026618447 /DNA_START=851 /DNA_END=1033 /DNA_ORIENTATION=+
MPGCKVTTEGLACPTAQHVVKVIPSTTSTAAAMGTAAAVAAQGTPMTYAIPAAQYTTAAI